MWKLVPPRPPKTRFYYIRGKYLGIELDHSTGTGEEAAAKRILKTWSKQAERGEFPLGKRRDEPAPATFVSAATAYMQAGGSGQYLEPILKAWSGRLLADIDQIAIDTLAETLYPAAPASTKNRQFYTPVSAILKRAGIEKRIKRPKGWRGRKSISWLSREQAFALLTAAEQIEPEFGMFCELLCYTGMRLGEALSIRLSAVDLARQAIYLPETKNGEARTVHLTPELVAALANHPRGLDRRPDERLVRFHASGRLRDMLKEAMAKAGLSFPRRQCGFHLFCHTYGTWMHRENGMDNYALARTGRWKDPRSAEAYLHTAVSAEARMADNLPVRPKRGAGVERKGEVG